MKMLAIFCWAFASGIPLMLLTATLSARLLQSGVSLVTIGMFATALLPYALKFLGGPMVENFSLPFLTRFVGRTRAWMLSAMTGTMLSIFCIAFFKTPSQHLHLLYFIIFMTACCSACSDIAEAKLRIELLSSMTLAIGNTFYIVGYGFGELLAGGGALLLAGKYNWSVAYAITASFMCIGLCAVMLQKPALTDDVNSNNTVLEKPSLLQTAFILPIKAFSHHPEWLAMLFIVLFYYAASYLTTMMINPFYLQLGLSTTQLGSIRSVIGLFSILIAGPLAGFLATRYGIMRILLSCAVLYIVNAIFQASLAQMILNHIIAPQSQLTHWLFIAAISFTNIIDVISVISYITLIASLCRPPFIATQNALLTSMMAISRVLFSAIGGYSAQHLGWAHFFLLTTLCMLPVIFILKKINASHKTSSNITNGNSELI